MTFVLAACSNLDPENVMSKDIDIVDSLDVRIDVRLATGYSVVPEVKSGSLMDYLETKITNLALVIRPDAATEQESWALARMYPLNAEDLVAGVDSYTLSTTLRLSAGRKTAYLLVNSSPEMLSSIHAHMKAEGLRMSRNSAYTACFARENSLAGSDFGEAYASVMDEFVNDGRGMAMAAVSMNPMEVVRDQPVHVSFNLRRLVAKILFTCETYPVSAGGTEFVKIKSLYSEAEAASQALDVYISDLDTDKESQAGWVPLSSVHYTLNALNTKVYIEPYTLPAGVQESNYIPDDPNFSLGEQVEAIGNDWVISSRYAADYIHKDDASLQTLFRSAGPSSGKWMKSAIRYDAGFDYLHTMYGDEFPGLYCLENTVDPGSYFDGYGPEADIRKVVPRLVTTHLYIESRFVPRYFVIGNAAGSDERRYVGARSMEESLSHLPAVEVVEKGVARTIPEGTFFTTDLRTFYSYAGMMAEIERSRGSERPVTRADFAEYTSGLCHYASYIAGTPSSSNPETAYVSFSKNSSVKRDGFYVLTADVMKVPSITNVMMDLRTQSRIMWAPEGSGEQTFKP